MRKANINDSQPQNVQLPISTFDVKGIIDKNEAQLATSIVLSIFAHINELVEYQDEINIKQINLILGREESLRVEYLQTLSTEKKDILQESALEAIRELAHVQTNQQNDVVIDTINAIYNIPSDELAHDIQSIDLNISQLQTEASNNPQIETTQLTEESEENTLIKTNQNTSDSYVDSQYKEIIEFIQVELDKIKTYTKLNCRFIVEENSKMSRKTIRMMNRVVAKLFQEMAKFNAEIDRAFQMVVKFEDRIQTFFTYYEKSIKKWFSKLSKMTNKIVGGLIRLYYTTPPYIGVWILALSAIIFGISYFIAKYRPLLFFIIDKVVPGIGMAIKWIAEVFVSIYPIMKKIINIGEQILNFIETTIMSLVERVFKKVVKPILTKIFDSVQKFKTMLWPKILPTIMTLQDKVMNFFTSDLIDRISTIITLIVEKGISFVDEVLMPACNAILSLLNSILTTIRSYISSLVDTVLSTAIMICTTIKTVAVKFAQFVVNSFISLMNLMQDMYRWLKEEIFSGFPRFVESLTSVGKMIVDKIMAIIPEWIRKGAAAVKNGLKAVGKALWSVFSRDKRANMTLPQLKNEHSELLKKIKQLEPLINLHNEALDINKVSTDTVTDIFEILQALFKKLSNAIYDLMKVTVKIDTLSTNAISQTISQTTTAQVANQVDVNLTESQTPLTSLQQDKTLVDVNLQDKTTSSNNTVIMDIDKTPTVIDVDNTQTNDKPHVYEQIDIEYCNQMFATMLDKIATRVKYVPFMYQQSKQYM